MRTKTVFLLFVLLVSTALVATGQVTFNTTPLVNGVVVMSPSADGQGIYIVGTSGVGKINPDGTNTFLAGQSDLNALPGQPPGGLSFVSPAPEGRFSSPRACMWGDGRELWFCAYETRESSPVGNTNWLVKRSLDGKFTKVIAPLENILVNGVNKPYILTRTILTSFRDPVASIEFSGDVIPGNLGNFLGYPRAINLKNLSTSPIPESTYLSGQGIALGCSTRQSYWYGVAASLGFGGTSLTIYRDGKALTGSPVKIIDLNGFTCGSNGGAVSYFKPDGTTAYFGYYPDGSAETRIWEGNLSVTVGSVPSTAVLVDGSIITLLMVADGKLVQVDSTGAKFVPVSGIPTQVAVSGTQVYVLANTSVYVSRPPLPPIIASFSVNPKSIKLGESARLDWTALNTSKVAITENPLSKNPCTKTLPVDSCVVTPLVTTTYTINANGATEQITLEVITPVPTPKINAIVSAADEGTGIGIVPGSLATLYGENLQGGSVKVLFGNVQAPILYAGPNQINLQVPLEMAAPGDADVTVVTDNGTTSSFKVHILATAPGIFQVPGPFPAIVDAQGHLVTYANPMQVGGYYMFFLTGLGRTTCSLATGQAAPTDGRLCPTKAQVTVQLDGAQARVDFAGLAPGFTGLYQVNIFILGDPIPTGTETSAQNITGTLKVDTSETSFQSSLMMSAAVTSRK